MLGGTTAPHSAALHAGYGFVVPAQAGTHIPEAATQGTMGPRLRGDDRLQWWLASY